MLQLFRTLFFLLICFILTIGSAGYWFYQNKLETPFPIVNQVRYTVPPGANLTQVAMDLMEKDIIDYPSALTWVMLARFQKRAHLIKTGDYVIQVGTTPQQFLDILINGKTTPPPHTLLRSP